VSSPINHKLLQNLLFYLFFSIIFIVSFLWYSPYGNIRFSSDYAVHVLMAHDLRLPHDLYYWGQNRLGSLVPILAHGLYKGLGIDVWAAVTCVHYGFLLCTALMVCRYFKTHIYKLVFLAIWLLPVPEFDQHLLLGHPYAPQLFLLMAGLYLHERKPERLWLRSLLFFAGNLLLFLSCWVSELSAFFIAAYYLLLGIRFLARRKTMTIHLRLFLINCVSNFLAALLIYWLIHYAKAHATRMDDYSQIFVPAKIWWKGIALHWNNFTGVIKLIGEDPLKGIYALVFCLVLLLLAALVLRQKLRPVLSFYPSLFFCTGFGSWCFLYSLYWTSHNSFDYKYWCFSYFFVFLSVLMIAERCITGRKVLLTGFCMLLICHLPITWRYATDKTYWSWEVGFYKSQRNQYKKLGNCGLIGNYWYTYSISCSDPDSIVATPHDKDYVRNPRYVPQVFRKKTIYLVMDIWLTEWPQTTSQFGHRLVKAGTPFTIEQATFCRYRLADGS
jgi:hypothetical protein